MTLKESVHVENLHKKFHTRITGFLRPRYRIVEALRGVSFTIREGCIYCLLGPNGAGKTTTVKIISTLLIPDQGDALVLGYSSVREPLKVRKLLGAMLSVEKGFFWKLTGRENLRYFALLYNVDNIEERVERALEIVGLKELGGDEQRFEDMSLGMKARLGLARVLVKDPKVMILDEPTLGLDPASSRSIRELLVKLKSEGRSILLTTHNMFEAERVCDRIGIIYKGRIIVEGTIGELKRRIGGDYLGVTVRFRGDSESAERLARLMHGLLVPVEGEEGLWRLRVEAARGEEEKIIGVLLEKARDLGVRIVGVSVEEPSLEDVFLKVTGGGKWD